MARSVFWLSNDEWRRIETWLPRGRGGARRVDDRRVISGIIHVLKTGCRWRDSPAGYAPFTTIYNRFNRWSKQGAWKDVFYALSGSSGVVGTMAVDSDPCQGAPFGIWRKGGTIPDIRLSRYRIEPLDLGELVRWGMLVAGAASSTVGGPVIRLDQTLC